MGEELVYFIGWFKLSIQIDSIYNYNNNRLEGSSLLEEAPNLGFRVLDPLFFTAMIRVSPRVTVHALDVNIRSHRVRTPVRLIHTLIISLYFLFSYKDTA